MKIEPKLAKSLIRESGPSVFSWSEVYLNPYQGCYHNCVYCDGKSEHYHMHEDFGDRIFVKTNAPKLFRQYLKRKGFQQVHNTPQRAMDDFFPSLKSIPNTKTTPKKIFTIGGGVCDVYQQPEQTEQMTQKLLQIIYDFQLPVLILTKNSLVLRDLELLKAINEESYACVNFTITLMDEHAQQVFEPRASPSSERFEAIRKLSREGIQCGVYSYPSLPFIGNTDDNLQAIYQKAKEVGAEFIYCDGLTLKPGRNKLEFMTTIKDHYPELYPKYQQLYGNNNKYGMIDVDAASELGEIWPFYRGYKYAYEFGLNYAMPRYVPEGQFEVNLKLAEILRRIVYVKGNIIQRNSYEINALNKAARMLENTTRDFSQLTREEYDDIPTNKNVRKIIIQYLETGRSQILDDIQDQAYEKINNDYYS